MDAICDINFHNHTKRRRGKGKRGKKGKQNARVIPANADDFARLGFDRCHRRHPPTLKKKFFLGGACKGDW